MSIKFKPPRFVRAFFQKLHRPKNRFCLKLDELEMSILRRKADLQEDESFVMLIDDSMFCKRTKNIVFTDKRILWQEKRGAQYKSISLASLSCASVFFEPFGFGSVITVLNENSCAQFRFKNFRAGDSLRIIFHDYLSRYCEGYASLEKENEARYKKECVPSFKRHSIASLVFALAGCALISMLGIFVANYNEGYTTDGLLELFYLGIAFLLVNMFLPASKSKVAKSFLLVLFLIFSVPLCCTDSLDELGRNVFILFAFVFLKIDRFESDGVENVMPIYTVIVVLILLWITFLCR